MESPRRPIDFARLTKFSQRPPTDPFFYLLTLMVFRVQIVLRHYFVQLQKFPSWDYPRIRGLGQEQTGKSQHHRGQIHQNKGFLVFSEVTSVAYEK